MFLGAAHIYVLDYLADNLPELKETLGKAYPNTMVKSS
jgi:hypothetical protein